MDSSLLERVAAAILSPPGSVDGPPSLLTVSSVSYGVGVSDGDEAWTSHLDPVATAFFEAVVESAFLVANADGDFDETEQQTFRQVVLAACEGRVLEPQMSALLADLRGLLAEDGLARRVAVVAKCVEGPEQGWEVMRVSALIAVVSGGVSEIERRVLERLATALGLSAAEVARAIDEARQAIGVTSTRGVD